MSYLFITEFLLIISSTKLFNKACSLVRLAILLEIAFSIFGSLDLRKGIHLFLISFLL